MSDGPRVSIGVWWLAFCLVGSRPLGPRTSVDLFELGIKLALGLLGQSHGDMPVDGLKDAVVDEEGYVFVIRNHFDLPHILLKLIKGIKLSLVTVGARGMLGSSRSSGLSARLGLEQF